MTTTNSVRAMRLETGDMTEHQFGGPWTEIKLDAVVYYLQCYTKALKKVPFDLWYIDAFAGTGERTSQRLVGGLFEGQPVAKVTEILAGSARRALTVRPSFDHFVFIEQDAKRFAALSHIASENSRRDILCLTGEANRLLRDMAARPPWNQTGPARGVVFLDPYALQVEWKTLEALAATQKLDVWYLFPLRDVVRQLARDYRGIGPKQRRLDVVLSPAWRELYKLPKPAEKPKQLSLLGETEDAPERDATMLQIESWFHGRLQTIFPHVSDPLPLLTGQARQAFSLFLAIANPSRPAIDLAKHFSRHVRQKYSPEASRRRSGP